MENMTKVTFQIEVAAHKLISQYMLNNESIQKELEDGIKHAFDNFDFKQVVSEQVQETIKSAIRSSADWGKIRDMVRAKTDVIVESHIDKVLKDLQP